MGSDSLTTPDSVAIGEGDDSLSLTASLAVPILPNRDVSASPLQSPTRCLTLGRSTAGHDALTRHDEITKESTTTNSRSTSQTSALTKHAIGGEDLTPFKLGAYRLGKRLGRGGMGVVYHAVHDQLDKAFAIKFVCADNANSAELFERFLHEQRTLGSLNHQHIVCAIDAGQGDGFQYCVTELLSGRDLTSWIAERGCPSIGAACEVIRQAALGLEHAHSSGVVHRDVKPSNLFLELNGQLKVLDFGLARRMTQSSELTQVGSLVGTVDYFSPEQAEDCRRADARSDIYSLGAVFVYLLSGQAPYPDAAYPNVVSKLRGHMADTPPWLARQSVSLPPTLRRLLLSMIAKAPKDRPASCAQVAAEIKAFARSDELREWIQPEPSQQRAPSLLRCKSMKSTRFALLQRAVAAAISIGLLACASLPIFSTEDHLGSLSGVDSPAQRAAYVDEPTEAVAELDANHEALQRTETPSSTEPTSDSSVPTSATVPTNTELATKPTNALPLPSDDPSSAPAHTPSQLSARDANESSVADASMTSTQAKTKSHSAKPMRIGADVYNARPSTNRGTFSHREED